MNDHKDPLLMNHEADGIKELDNLLPRWWVWLFYGSIAFSVVYMFYYHVFHLGDLQDSHYVKELRKGEEIKAKALTAFESSLGTLQPSHDPTTLSKGQETFNTLCAPCHRTDGGGLVGPNLTDDYWIHGSNFVDNLKIIVNGVPEKGMVTWKGILKPSDILAVASHVYALRGTNPQNPKPPENQQQQPTGPSAFE
jgi:cytochrome c oxidase cbb3-type subunit 3